ncbi:carboxymuconolactone decarboxylase family protein [Mycobacteroides franklinii]|uniref:carboxymuconolactone decarboxylase family protein n=1 Tax=Mycobacteroides franklinii TaxID=948102 RepID=UPI000992E5DB|nr:carboxymuconolactone decarboxylase family protein [Mycobacteroides franklinii]
MDDVRRQGLDKMKEVYGWDMPDIPGDYFKYTIEHLFGTIWTRPELSMRDRRLLLLGAVSALGLDEILEIQTGAALKNGELTEAELREVAIFITHYVGWPLGQRVNKHVEMAVAQQNKAERAKESSGD